MRFRNSIKLNAVADQRARHRGRAESAGSQLSAAQRSDGMRNAPAAPAQFEKCNFIAETL